MELSNGFTAMEADELYFINGGRANIARPGRDELHCIDDAGNVYIPSSSSGNEKFTYKDKTTIEEKNEKVTGNLDIDIKAGLTNVHVEGKGTYENKTTITKRDIEVTYESWR